MGKKSNSNKKIITFQGGKVCIKDDFGNLDIQDDSCISTILKGIDDYIETNPKIMRISTIISDVLKSNFQVDKIVIANEDCLYTFLTKHIRKNTLYAERIQKQREIKHDDYLKIQKNRFQEGIFLGHLRDVSYAIKKRKNYTENKGASRIWNVLSDF